MSKINYIQQPLLVDLPDLPIEGGSVVKRKGELVQFVYEPGRQVITVTYDVVPYTSTGERIESGGIIQPYRALVTADYSTFVAEDDGHILCNASEEYLPDSSLNPALVGKQYMYRYEWHNRNGWDVHRVIMDGIRVAIYDDFMRTNYPPVPPEPPVDVPIEYVFVGQLQPPLLTSFCSMENADQSSPGTLWFSNIGTDYTTDNSNKFAAIVSGSVLRIQQQSDKWQEYMATEQCIIDSGLITVANSVHWNASGTPLDVNQPVVVTITAPS